jgi:protein SCO1/2
MKRARAILVLTLLACLPALADVSDQTLREIQFDQKVGAHITMSAPFVDEAGKRVTLADCADGKPTILVLGYYRCPMLCTVELNGMVAAMQDMTAEAADRAAVVFVSIDPNEKPGLAAAKKATYMKLYARKEAAPSWHFLTGSGSSITNLANEAGFRYVYDPSSRQFAHPSGLVILTPDGTISRYIFGVTFEAKDLASALRVAAARRTGGLAQQFIYLCFCYDPIRGKYGPEIMTAVRVGGVLTLAGMGGLIWMACPPRRKKEGT